jgi:hypothetical protein
MSKIIENENAKLYVERNDMDFTVSVWIVSKDGTRRVLYGRSKETGQITGFMREAPGPPSQSDHNLIPIIKCDASIWEMFESAFLGYCSKKGKFTPFERQSIEDKETMMYRILNEILRSYQ